MKKRFVKISVVIIFFLLLLVISLPIAFSLQTNQTFTYDGNGNLITGDGKYREYNEFNQLILIRNGSTNNDTILEEYIYHPTENRILIKKANPDGLGNDFEEVTVYINENFVRHRSTVGVDKINNSYYVKDDIGIVGEIIFNTTENGNKSTLLEKRFYHGDHLGSTTLITNDSGDVISETFYTPYGGILSGGNVSRYAYEGKEYSNLVDDYDFHFRKYNPELGVFTQPDSIISDPYNPQALNEYAFELRNPYKYADPDGHFVDVLVDIGFIAYDIYELSKDPDDPLNQIALGADVAAAFIPFVAGAGFAAKAGAKGVKIAGEAGNVVKDTNRLTKEAQSIANELGGVSDRFSGTVKHSIASNKLKQAGINNLYTEISLKENKVVSYGTKGSTRIDALTSSQDLSKIGTRVDQSRIGSCCDFKFGKSTMSREQASRISSQTGKSPNIIKPIIKKIKSFFGGK